MRRIWTLLCLPVGLALGLAACGEDTPGNSPPEIDQILATATTLVPGETARLVALAGDPNGDRLSFHWTAGAGSFIRPDSMVTLWTAPDSSDVYTIRVEVSDGDYAVSDSIDIFVGQGTIAVTSDPPGAEIFLDFSPTFFTTPHVFEGVATGVLHTVQLSRDEIPFEPEQINVFIEEGDSTSADFYTPASTVEPLDLGREDVSEIGAFSWSPFGHGFVYVAVTQELGKGIYNYNLAVSDPDSGAGLITGDVDLNEPVSLYTVGSVTYMVWTGEAGELLHAQMSDPDNDGLYDKGPTQTLREEGYGADVSEETLLFSLQPSTAEAGLFWGDLTSGTLPGWQEATGDFGSNASWKPGSRDFFVFVSSGHLLRAIRPSAAPLPPDTLAVSAPVASPDWGKQSIAFLNGDAFTSVSMQMETGTLAAELYDQLTDPRDVEWHPSGVFLVVTHNPPGGGEALKIENLPLAH